MSQLALHWVSVKFQRDYAMLRVILTLSDSNLRCLAPKHPFNAGSVLGSPKRQHRPRMSGVLVLSQPLSSTTTRFESESRNTHQTQLPILSLITWLAPIASWTRFLSQAISAQLAIDQRVIGLRLGSIGRGSTHQNTTWRLLCRSFWAKACFLIKDYD